MMEDYNSDPYLGFAIKAGLAPAGATKKSHKLLRAQMKPCVLGLLYGMGRNTLAQRIGQSPVQAAELIRVFKESYFVFQQWQDRVVDHAMMHNELYTRFGWYLHCGPDSDPLASKPLSLRNFPMQANCAGMLHLACIRGVEKGIKIVAPLHDALFIEAPIEMIEEHVRVMRKIMEEASVTVLRNLKLRVGVEVVRFPGRFMDKRGVKFWNKVQSFLPDPQYVLEEN
jgi:DNA polymerase I